MQQIVLQLGSGNLELIEVPIPQPSDHELLIKTEASMISNGTERYLLQFGQSSWLQKLSAHKDKVHKVLDNIKTEGLQNTYLKVKQKLDDPIAMGYCNVGEVVAIGKAVKNFKIGDRVISNGAHADYVTVSANLAVCIPKDMPVEKAVFGIPMAIALEGIRLAKAEMGQCGIIVGMGLLGQLAARLLKHLGLQVLAIDPYFEQSADHPIDWHGKNIEDIPLFKAKAHLGQGFDFCLLCGEQWEKSDFKYIAQGLKYRGHIVQIGNGDVAIPRDAFYKKEISYQVSCAYGYGRYQWAYEDNLEDWDLADAPWTIQRQLQTVVNFLKLDHFQIGHFPIERFPLQAYQQAYQQLLHREPRCFVFDYTTSASPAASIKQAAPSTTAPIEGQTVVVGSGQYVAQYLLPQLQENAVTIHSLLSAHKLAQAAQLQSQFKIEQIVTDIPSYLARLRHSTVFIANKHHLHAPQLLRLEASNVVMVEKPLCLNAEELQAIAQQSWKALMVGYNRRYAPMALAVKAGLHKDLPIQIQMHINAGSLPEQSWLNNPLQSGGRIIGELCHWLDLFCYWAGSRIQEVVAFSNDTIGNDALPENVMVMLTSEKGDTAQILYSTIGHMKYPKEHITLTQAQQHWQIDNWQKLYYHGSADKKYGKVKAGKGHEEMYQAFLRRENLIDKAILFNVSASTFAIHQSIEQRMVVNVQEHYGF